jgi:hypothetical protein
VTPDEDTAIQPLLVGHPVRCRNERYMVVALTVAYLAAGAVLAFACLQLTAVADQINSTPYCRRI